MYNKILTLFTILNIIYTNIEKKISLFIFKYIPNKYFKFTNRNKYIKSIVFNYLDDNKDVTNKFKWLYKDNIYYDDLKDLYLHIFKLNNNEHMKQSNIDINICNIIIESDNDCIIIDIINDKYCIKSIDNVMDNICFNIIPLYHLV